jgi:hypothetical protein
MMRFLTSHVIGDEIRIYLEQCGDKTAFFGLIVLERKQP